MQKHFSLSGFGTIFSLELVVAGRVTPRGSDSVFVSLTLNKHLEVFDLLMGLFDMFKKAFGMDVDEGKEQEQIQNHISMAFGDKIKGLNIAYADETVTISGEADSLATKQKAVLMAGNVKGVEAVNDMLTVAEPELRHYTIQSGDSLSKIAKEVYGDFNKWEALFAANREVIKDPDLIYPGQIILIPEL